MVCVTSACVILVASGHLEDTDCGSDRDAMAAGIPRGRKGGQRERRTEKGGEESGKGRKGPLPKGNSQTQKSS